MNNETPAPVGQSFAEWWKLQEANGVDNVCEPRGMAYLAWHARDAEIAALKAKLLAAEAGALEKKQKINAAYNAYNNSLDGSESKLKAAGLEIACNIISDRDCGQSIEARLEAGEKAVEALRNVLNYPEIRGFIGKLTYGPADAVLASYDATSAPRDGKRGEGL